MTTLPVPRLYLALSVPVTVFPARLPEKVPVASDIGIPVLATFVPLMMTGFVLS